MSAEIIPFDFEEQAVRVLMRDGEPWFVAADVCRVLEIQNATDSIKRLDDDEVTLDTIEGSHRQTNLISESGLYALILTSRKPEARRFRKWITAEVLPAIRRHGRYDLAAPAQASTLTGLGDCPARDAELWLGMIREARLVSGSSSARSLWARSPLPQLTLSPVGAGDPAEGRACMAHLLGFDAGGGSVAVLVARAADGDLVAHTVLGHLGLRPKPTGLFVANGEIAVFRSTRWAGGMQRAALLAVPGAAIAEPCTLAGYRARGVIVPVPPVDLEQDDE